MSGSAEYGTGCAALHAPEEEENKDHGRRGVMRAQYWIQCLIGVLLLAAIVAAFWSEYSTRYPRKTRAHGKVER